MRGRAGRAAGGRGVRPFTSRASFSAPSASQVLYQGLEKLEKEKANREHLEMEIDVVRARPGRATCVPGDLAGHSLEALEGREGRSPLGRGKGAELNVRGWCLRAMRPLRGSLSHLGDPLPS